MRPLASVSAAADDYTASSGREVVLRNSVDVFSAFVSVGDCIFVPEGFVRTVQFTVTHRGN